MSIADLVFTRTADGETIYDPETVTGTLKQITVTNMGTDPLTGLGLYIVPATNVGEVDFPADYAPETDYDDVITWGTKADLAIIAQGGVYLSGVPQNGGGTFTGNITRSAGAIRRNKIPFIDLAAGASATFSMRFDTPPGEPARRFFVSLVLE